MDSLTNIRNYTRVFGITLFDFILTFFAAFLVYTFTNIGQYGLSKQRYYASLIPLGVIIHMLFNQRTAFNKGLYEYKLVNWIILLVCLYLVYTG